MVSRFDFPFRASATLPRKRGILTLSWPLAQITVNDEGLECDIGPSFAKLISASGDRTFDHQGKLRSGVWSCTWDQVAGLLFARHSIIVQLKNGRGCRFAFSRPAYVQRIRDEFDMHGIPSRIVWFTYVRAFRL